MPGPADIGGGFGAPVKSYAMIGLAGAGDDRGWEPASARLRGVTMRFGGAKSGQ
jgi:hypothetical protein